MNIHSPTNEPKPWLALRVGSRKEKAVLRSLLSRGVESYVPIRDKYYRYASKSVVRQLPILPGYVFVAPNSKAVASSLLAVNHVYGYVKTGKRVSEITEREINHLRRLCGSTHLDWDEQDEASTEPTTGAILEIVRGPLTGIRGKFVERKSKQVFIVQLGAYATQLSTLEVAVSDVAVI